jgi:hypothetical protein
MILRAGNMLTVSSYTRKLDCEVRHFHLRVQQQLPLHAWASLLQTNANMLPKPLQQGTHTSSALRVAFSLVSLSICFLRTSVLSMALNQEYRKASDKDFE